MTNRILLVDDEPLNLEIMNDYLEDLPYQLIIAESGDRALSILEKDQNFDLILLDRMMPGKNGVEVLQELKGNENTKRIPVVMQTAADEEKQIEEGIEAGAFYYLTKPYSEMVLRSIVQSALKDRKAEQDLLNDLDRHAAAMAHLEYGTFKVKTIDEARAVGMAVSFCFPRPEEVYMGLSELMVNAVEHGNYGISYLEKKTALLAGTWEATLERAANKPEVAEKYVDILVTQTEKRTKVEIKDQGAGFDWKQYMAYSPNRATDPNGRGIGVYAVHAFDTINYHGAGNHVVVTGNH